MKDKLSIGIVLLVSLALIYGAYYFISGSEDYSITVIDVNPSIMLFSDENDVIVDTEMLNDDAYIAFEDDELIGMELDEAVDHVVDNLIDMGYIDEFSDENDITIETEQEGEVDNEEFRNKVLARVQAKLDERGISARVGQPDRDLETEATEKGIEHAKLMVMRAAMNKNEDLTEEELLDMSIRDIARLISQNAKRTREVIEEEYDDDFEGIRSKLKEERKIIGEIIEENVATFSELTKEEKKELIEENKERIQLIVSEAKDRIKNGAFENANQVKEDVMEQVEKIRNLAPEGSVRDIQNKIVNDASEIRNRVSDTLRNVEPREAREIERNIKERLTKFYEDGAEGDIDQFRESIIEGIMRDR